MGPKRRNPKRNRSVQEVVSEENGSTYAKKLRRKMLTDKETQKSEKHSHDREVECVLNDCRNKESIMAELMETQRCDRDLNETTAFHINFASRKKKLSVDKNWTYSYLQNSLNFIHHHYQASVGLISHPALNHRQNVCSQIINLVSNMQLYRTGSPFDRRVTAMEWHPTNPDLVAVGSKGGDIFLWDTETVNNNDNFIHGIGAGGSIQAVKFWPWNWNRVVTSSIDGRITLQDFNGRKTDVLSDTFNCHEGPGGNVSGMKFHPFHSHRLYTSTLDGRLTLQDFMGKHKEIYLDTMTWDFWYCSLDVSSSHKVVVTGDNVGNTILLSDEGKKLWSHKLHKGKVTHTEFSPREDWLLCTASIDHTVKMWDIRMISGKQSALCCLNHDKGINSAYFSLTDGCRLLTTDQGSDIRVYRAPEWCLERTILHPHRFFQHITPIKAAWHPLQDLIVVGRYPDKAFPGYTDKEKRTIDVLDAASGKIVCQLHDPAAPGIISLNKFNTRGDKLASGMGVNILVWSRQEDFVHKQEDLLKKFKQHGVQPTSDSSHRPARRRTDSKQTKTKTETKLKTKVKTKTKQL